VRNVQRLARNPDELLSKISVDDHYVMHLGQFVVAAKANKNVDEGIVQVVRYFVEKFLVELYQLGEFNNLPIGFPRNHFEIT
jgi:hypothetical protein